MINQSRNFVGEVNNISLFRQMIKLTRYYFLKIIRLFLKCLVDFLKKKGFKTTFIRKIKNGITIFRSILIYFYSLKFKKINTVVIGPFRGELGYELLYWIPFVNYFLRKKKIANVIIITRKPMTKYYKKIIDAKSVKTLKFYYSDNFKSQKQSIMRRDIFLIKKFLTKLNHYKNIFLLHPKYFYSFLRLNNIDKLDIKKIRKLLDFDFLENKEQKKYLLKKKNISIWIYKNDYIKKNYINLEKLNIFNNCYKVNIIHSDDLFDGHKDFDEKQISFFKKNNVRYVKYSKKKFHRDFPKIQKALDESLYFITSWGGACYLGFYHSINTISLYDNLPRIHKRHRYIESCIEKLSDKMRYIKYRI